MKHAFICNDFLKWFLHISDITLRSVNRVDRSKVTTFLQLKSTCIPIFGNLLLSHFTDHGLAV